MKIELLIASKIEGGAPGPLGVCDLPAVPGGGEVIQWRGMAYGVIGRGWVAGDLVPGAGMTLSPGRVQILVQMIGSVAMADPIEPTAPARSTLLTPGR